MSRNGGLVEHVKRVLHEMKTNPQANMFELVAELCKHAEDVEVHEREQMAREDRSKGVGA